MTAISIVTKTDVERVQFLERTYAGKTGGGVERDVCHMRLKLSVATVG